MDLTIDRIQSISTKCATSFFVEGITPSKAIAEEAVALELNPEQIKRIIEATNTIIYLKKLGESQGDDRTFEFPVASYPEVMQSMCLPDKVAADAVEDSHKENTTPTNAIRVQEDLERQVEKVASVNMPEHGKLVLLSQEYLKAKGGLEKLATDKVEVNLKLAEVTKALRKDPQGFDKVALHVPKELLPACIGLCGFEMTKVASINAIQVFTRKDLESVYSLVGLYKEASQLLRKEREINEFIKKAEEVFLEKKLSCQP